jgi:hypothetical protein
MADGPGYYFVTLPPVGSRRKHNFWLLGDFGVGKGHADWEKFGKAALKVRDAFIAVNGSPHVDGVLMLGDISYESGSEEQLNAGTFDVYPAIMSNSFTWPAMGNHETYTEITGYPYRKAFNLPMRGEAGGVASNSEYYYAWNHGNIHFIVLEFEVSSRAKGGAQYQWLEQDLQSKSARDADWIIAYWHHTPYTCCHHNSETEAQLVNIRYNFLPLLERYGTDLVFVGHSHNYERSMLLNGAYSFSDTSTDQDAHYKWYADNKAKVVLNTHSGSIRGSGPYRKKKGANLGTVYTIVGSGGKLDSTAGLHPMMKVKHVLQGSVLLDVEDSVANVRFIDTARAIRDDFRMVKSRPQVPTPVAKSPAAQAGFTRAGRSFRFAEGNAMPLRIYGTSGALLSNGIHRGSWQPTTAAIPPGEYYYRFGSDFGKVSLP